jgi:hypothetical protein
MNLQIYNKCTYYLADCLCFATGKIAVYKKVIFNRKILLNRVNCYSYVKQIVNVTWVMSWALYTLLLKIKDDWKLLLSSFGYHTQEWYMDRILMRQDFSGGWRTLVTHLLYLKLITEFTIVGLQHLQQGCTARKFFSTGTRRRTRPIRNLLGKSWFGFHVKLKVP